MVTLDARRRRLQPADSLLGWDRTANLARKSLPRVGQTGVWGHLFWGTSSVVLSKTNFLTTGYLLSRGRIMLPLDKPKRGEWCRTHHDLSRTNRSPHKHHQHENIFSLSFPFPLYFVRYSGFHVFSSCVYFYMCVRPCGNRRVLLLFLARSFPTRFGGNN